jgi:hypothetical protein
MFRKVCKTFPEIMSGADTTFVSINASVFRIKIKAGSLSSEFLKGAVVVNAGVVGFTPGMVSIGTETKKM